MTERQVVVIGGGLAGISAAITLRDAGVGVTLLEARPRLGGAAASFARGPLMIDNGQHVFLRCCQSYQELLARLGVAESVTIQDRFDITILSTAGPARLRRTGLPSPLHLTRALAGYGLLSVRERAMMARAALAFRFADPTRPELDDARLGDWLTARGQTERARRRMWDLFIVSALNIDGDEASVPLATTVIKTALLGRRDAADIGMATVPLGQLHGTAAAAVLGGLGAQVRLRTRVAGVEKLHGGGFRVSVSDGAAEPDRSGPADPDRPGPAAPDRFEVVADGVVLAVPWTDAARLGVTAGLTEAAGWSGLGHSPIVNVHVVYDQQVMSLPFAAAVDSPVQWVFDKTTQSGLKSGQYLAVSLSAADSYVDKPTAALREEFLPALEQLFPAAAGATVADFFVTRERRATFRQAPGCGALRPGAATSAPGLTLAGAWTDTGWPDTMEGAVRSGRAAALQLIEELAWLPARDRQAELQTSRTGAP